MSKVSIMPPDSTVLEAAAAVEAAAHEVHSRIVAEPHFCETAVAGEVLALWWAMLRHVQATIELARADMALVPAGMVTARAALETGVNIIWMTQPDDEHERVRRSLRRGLDHMRWEEFFGDFLVELGIWYDECSKHLRNKNQEIRERILEEGFDATSTERTVKARMEAIGMGWLYLMYCLFSHFAHGTLLVSDWYDRGVVGRFSCVGDTTVPADWMGPLFVCYFIVLAAGKSVLKTVDVSVDKPVDPETNRSFFTALTAMLLAEMHGQGIPWSDKP